MKKLFLFLVSVSLLLFLSRVALPQSGSTGAIEGKVTDDEGNRLPGAEVKISSPDLIGGTQAKITSAQGKFRFILLLRGTYTLEASLSGFVPEKKEGIKLYVGQTLTVDLALKIGTLEEEVTVRGIAPLVDVKDSQINITNLDRQMLQTVGSENRIKDVTALINFAPGVKDDSAMGSASRVSNQWQYDGQSLATFIGSGADWQHPDINDIEEAQVTGSGANAEYGGFTGAILNFITKSGGNTFEGMAEFSYSPLKWNTKNFDQNEPKFSLYKAPPRSLFFDAHVDLGGPIIRDKLWFFLSLSFMQFDNEIIGFKKRYSQQIPRSVGKLTFQLDKNNRISAFFQWEYWQVFNRGLSVSRPDEATYYDVGPGFPKSLSWYHSFSDTTFAEIKLGFYYSWYDQRANNGKDVPERYDYLTGMYSGNSSWWGESESNFYTANVNVTHHADEFLKGSHDFKFGVDLLKGFNNMRGTYTGGFRYVDNYPYSYYHGDYRYNTLAYEYSYDWKANGWKASAFAQDSWKIGNLTINPGVRWTMMRGYLPNLQDSAFFKPKSALEFRFGLTFDVFGDHTTAIKAHYGRYHESFKTGYFENADPGIEDWVIYEVLADGSKYETYRQSYKKEHIIDPNIRIPYSDQFTLGLERTLMKDTSLALTLIHRLYKGFIANIDTGTMWELFPWTYKDENGQLQTMDIYRRLPGYASSYLLTNPKKGQSSSVIMTPENKYTGFSIAINKRFSDGWMFHIDYTYSVSKGNHANNWSGGVNGWKYYENPNRQINADGYVTYDAPHALTVYGTATLPLGFILTPHFTLQSGRNWQKTITGPSYAGSPTILLESRGSRRYPARINLSLRLENVYRITDRVRIGFIFDVFNVFNRGLETGVGTNIKYATYNLATNVCAPRYIRVGVRFFY